MLREDRSMFLRLLLAIGLLWCTRHSHASILVEFDFTGQPGDQESTPASWTAPGVTATPFKRGFGLDPRAGANSIGAQGWTTGDLLDLNSDYFEFVISPSDGATLNINSIAFAEFRSANGITEFTLRSSLDDFHHDVIASPIAVPDDGNTRSHQLELGDAFDAIVSPIKFRLYGYRAENSSTSRWWIIDHPEIGVFRISGTASSPSLGVVTPEPSARLIWGLAAGGWGVCWGAGKWARAMRRRAAFNQR
jgi:hypothetical protein